MFTKNIRYLVTVFFYAAVSFGMGQQVDLSGLTNAQKQTYNEICQYRSFDSVSRVAQDSGSNVVMFVSSDACKELFKNSSDIKTAIKELNNAIVACLSKHPVTGSNSPPSTICIGVPEMSLGTVSDTTIECTKSAAEARRITSSFKSFIEGMKRLEQNLLKKTVNFFSRVGASFSHVKECMTRGL